MEPMLEVLAHHVALVIELIAVLVIALGSLQAVAGMVRLGFGTSKAAIASQRVTWLRYARWLVAGLTFQMAADIVNTSLAPTWDEIGHLASIAVIRTFLSYFLDKEMETKKEFLEGSEAP